MPCWFTKKKMVFENEFESVDRFEKVKPDRLRLSLLYKMSYIFIEVDSEEYFDKLVRDAKVLSKGLCPNSSFDRKIVTQSELKQFYESFLNRSFDVEDIIK